MGPRPGPVILDTTPLDSGHKTRGLGRYVQGLLEGFAALERRGELPVELILLRSSQGGTAADQRLFETVFYPRQLQRGAGLMCLENYLRLDGFLPASTALYHGTAMEGVTRRFPWLATCHDLIPLLLRGPYLRSWRLSQQLFWRAYAHNLRTRADHIVAISHHVKQTLIQHFGVSEAKVEVIHHGLSPLWAEDSGAATSPAIERLGRVPFALFVGGFDSRKNFDLAVSALRLIPRGERPALVVAGARSNMIKIYHRRLLRRHPLDVTFLEYTDDRDLRWLYSRCRCLLFPSREEGWGFPIVEAMAGGAPVICADQGSMQEAAGGAALTVDISSLEAIALAVRRLSSEESLRQQHITAGRARARELTWEETARKTAEVYRRMLDDRAALA